MREPDKEEVKCNMNVRVRKKKRKSQTSQRSRVRLSCVSACTLRGDDFVWILEAARESYLNDRVHVTERSRHVDEPWEATGRVKGRVGGLVGLGRRTQPYQTSSVADLS